MHVPVIVHTVEQDVAIVHYLEMTLYHLRRLVRIRIDLLCHIFSEIPDVPRLIHIAGLCLFAFRIPQNKSIFVAVCLFFFAFSTILGWNLFGKINVQYLFGKKSAVFNKSINIGIAPGKQNNILTAPILKMVIFRT